MFCFIVNFLKKNKMLKKKISNFVIKIIFLYSSRMLQHNYYKVSTEIEYIQTMGNRMAINGQKRFPGAVVTAQSRRKEEHEQVDKAYLLFLVQ